MFAIGLNGATKGHLKISERSEQRNKENSQKTVYGKSKNDIRTEDLRQACQ